jgi:L-threonylcarbamoyladenylate synthase
MALGDALDLILDGGRCTGGVPSTVVDASGASLTVLRAGAIPAEALRRL